MEAECINCHSNDFFIDSGYYYCKECGTKSDAVEYQTVAINVKHYDTAAKIKQNKADNEEKDEINVSQKYFARSYHSVFGFNEALDRIGTRLSSSTQIIFSICSVLVEKCGASEDISNVCMGIFQKYLSTYKVAFCKEELSDGNEETFKIRTHLKPYELKKLIKNKQKEVDNLIGKEINDKLLGLGLFDPVGDSVEIEKPPSCTSVALKPEDYYKIRETSVSIKALIRVYCGIHFIQMSDLMRWYREGRFPITQDQLNDIQLVKYNNSLSLFEVQPQFHNESLQMTNSSPLCKCNYSNMFLWQFLSLPRLLIPLDAFDELIGRYIYDLNLPKSFGCRIQKYRKIFNPFKNQNCDLWKENFCLIDNCADVVENKLSCKTSGFSFRNFYKVTLPKTIGCHTNYEISFIDFSTEVKAMALILFALKQEFSFNKKDEFEKPNDKNYFYFIDWLKQLNLRTQLADGKSMNYVTSERNLYSFKYTDKKIFDNRGNQLSYVFNDHLDSKFDHQIPSKNRIFMNQKFLADCLEDIIDVPRNSNNEDVLFAPIKFYGEECIYDNTLENNNTVSLIKRNFSNYKLKDFKDIEEKGHYLFPSVDFVNCLRIEEKINHEENRCKIYFSTQNLLTVYENIRESLPTLFNQLLYLLSKIIGEWPHVLYFAFLAVENAIVYRNEFEAFKTFLNNNEGVVIGEGEQKESCFVLYLNNFEENYLDLKIGRHSKNKNRIFKFFSSFSGTTIPQKYLMPETFISINLKVALHLTYLLYF